MQHLLKLKTAALAAVLSVAAELVFFSLALIGKATRLPGKRDVVIDAFLLFHLIPEWLVFAFIRHFKPFNDIQGLDAVIFIWVGQIVLALLQWYLIFFIIISLVRRYNANKPNAATSV